MISLRRKRSDESVPVGTMLDFAGVNLPDSFLWCDGTTLNRATYSDLFNALTFQRTASLVSGTASVTISSTTGFKVGMPLSGIGVPAGATVSVISNATTFIMSANATATTTTTVVVAPHGVGDGVSTFNVPDFRGRTSAGADDMGGVAAGRLTVAGSGLAGDRLGASGGSQSHTLSAAQMPAHRHATNLRGSGNNNTLFHFAPSAASNRAYASANNSDATGGFF